MRISVTLFIALLVIAPARLISAQSTAPDPGAAGWQALQNDDAEAARRLFGSALSVQPGDAVLHLGFGAAAHMLGREEEAQHSLRAALSLDPTLVHASRLLAELAFRRGDVDLAIATYERALVYAPDNVEMAARLDRLNTELARRRAAAQLTVAITGPDHAPLGEHARHVLTGAYWQVAKLVGAYPASAITVELNTLRPFQAVEHRRPSPGALDGRIHVDANGALSDLEAFDRALTFELVHAMIASMAPTGVPEWFAPGLAQLIATADAAVARRRLRGERNIPWARVDASASGPAQEAQARHDASLLMVRALLARIGPRSTQLLDGLSGGQSLDAALSQFGFTYADLKADVVRSLEP